MKSRYFIKSIKRWLYELAKFINNATHLVTRSRASLKFMRKSGNTNSQNSLNRKKSGYMNSRSNLKIIIKQWLHELALIKITSNNEMSVVVTPARGSGSINSQKWLHEVAQPIFSNIYPQNLVNLLNNIKISGYTNSQGWLHQFAPLQISGYMNSR
jgi:hypothetical protein